MMPAGGGSPGGEGPRLAGLGLKGQAFYEAIESRFPGLVEKIRRLVMTSEAKFSGGTAGFLWEHSVLAAALAFRLAEGEGIEPRTAALAALLHDAGKFKGGRYHEEDRPEEWDSAETARRLLIGAGIGRRTVETIGRALSSLYRSGGRRNRLADVLHDADFLAKSGILGVANFFVKSALRGRNLERMIMESLSKELTYAAALPRNMRTETGRTLAGKKSKDALRFHRAFLREYAAARGLEFAVRRFAVSFGEGAERSVGVFLVMPRRCGECGRDWRVGLRIERGIKCERLEADLSCPVCGFAHTVSFCLPELGGRNTQYT